jgi:3-oxoacyl-[acyl-carrier protein] reductase
MTPEQWKEVRDCHLDGHFYMNQAFARHLVANKTGGAIVNFSSVAHIFGWPRRLPYAVAKAGIDALTRTLAVEWAEFNIQVNAIAPGFIETEMTKSLDEKVVEEWRNGIPLKRGGQPLDVAKATVFLASDMSSYITGQTLHVCGGMLM